LVTTPACSSLKWITKLSAEEKLCLIADCLQLQKESSRTKNKKFRIHKCNKISRVNLNNSEYTTKNPVSPEASRDYQSKKEFLL